MKLSFSVHLYNCTLPLFSGEWVGTMLAGEMFLGILNEF